MKTAPGLLSLLALVTGGVLVVSSSHVALLAQQPRDHKTWRDYGGGPDNSKFMALDEIKKSNVNQLRVAWMYDNGISSDVWRSSSRGPGSTCSCTTVCSARARAGARKWSTGLDPTRTIVNSSALTFLDERLELAERDEILGPARRALRGNEPRQRDAVDGAPFSHHRIGFPDEVVIRATARDFTEQVERAERRRQREIQTAPKRVDVEAERESRRCAA